MYRVGPVEDPFEILAPFTIVEKDQYSSDQCENEIPSVETVAQWVQQSIKEYHGY